MKTYYKISEISRLYGVGPDSLRYYEKLGILKPKRDTNGYRMYKMNDLYKLNIIRDLRQLNFSMAQIRDYLKDLSLDNTLRLFQQEKSLLLEQQKKLKAQQAALTARIEELEFARGLPIGEIHLRDLPARPCAQISETVTRDEEVDFLMKKLHRRLEDQIHNLGSQMVGGIPDMDAVQQGRANVFSSVFFVLGPDTQNPDFVLPAGKYLSLCYQGSYEQSLASFNTLLNYAQEKGYTAPDDPFELYWIDNRSTDQTEEFLTEVQLRVLIP